MTTSGTAIGLAALGVTAGASEADEDAPEEQFRAYWVDAFNDGIYTPDQVRELVDSADTANHNAIIAQVVRRGDFFGDDALPPRTEAGIEEGFDPLRELVTEAHDAGLEVHAWMNINTMWNQEEAPEATDHPRNAHGPDTEEPWTSVREDGEVHVDGNYFFDPGHPGAADYLVETATSIVENYDVDGINLDYVRYPDYNSDAGFQTWGYNETALERFREATDYEGDGDPHPDDEAWVQWRRDQVTNLVRRIYLETYERDPDVRVSVNTIAWWIGPQQRDGGWEATGSYIAALQDWRGWMEEGIVDLNVPMNYNREHVESQAEMYRDWAEFAKDHQYGRQAVIGSGIYLNQIEGTVDQIRTALEPSEDGNEAVGWSGYSYATPDEQTLSGERSAADSRAELQRAVTEESEYDDEAEPVFAEEAVVPEMTWKTDPETGHLSGTVTTRAGDAVDGLTVTVSRREEVVATTTTTGNGWFGVVDLEPGHYRVQLPASETSGRRTVNVTVEAGSVADASVELVETK